MPPLVLLLFPVACSVALVIGIALWLSSKLQGPRMDNEGTILDTECDLDAVALSLIHFESSDASLLYKRARAHHHYGSALKNLLELKLETAPHSEVMATCKKYYDLELKFQDGDEIGAAHFFQSALGSSEATDLIFSSVKGSLLGKVKIWLGSHLHHGLTKLLASFRAITFTQHARFYFATVIQYTDLVNDLVLAISLIILGTPAAAMFGGLFVNQVLVVLEVSNVCSLWSHDSLTWRGKILSIVTIPFRLAYTRYKLAQLAIRRSSLCWNAKNLGENRLERLLSNLRRKREHLCSLYADLCMNDVLFEEIFFLAFLSDRFTDEFRNYFPYSEPLGTSFYFVMGLICLSITRGSIIAQDERLGGHFPFPGKMIAAVYTLLNIIANLGFRRLIKTARMEDYRTGWNIVVNKRRFYHSAFEGVYDVLNGTAISFEEVNKAFDPDEQHVDYGSMSFLSFIIYWLGLKLWPTLTLLHYAIQEVFYIIGLTAATFFLVLAYFRGRHLATPFDGWRMLKDSYQASVIGPPLHIAWTDSAEECGDVGKAWRESFALFALLSFFDLLSRVPYIFYLTELLWETRARNQRIKDVFVDLLPRELEAEQEIYHVLVAFIALTIALLMIRLLLYVAFYRYGHPWSIILRARVPWQRPRLASIFKWRRSYNVTTGSARDGDSGPA